MINHKASMGSKTHYTLFFPHEVQEYLEKYKKNSKQELIKIETEESKYSVSRDTKNFSSTSLLNSSKS